MQTWNAQHYADNARYVADLGLSVLKLLAPKAGQRILDLGCGDGALTLKIAQLGCEVVAVDSSPEQIQAAIELGLNAQVIDGSQLPFENEFDAVFSNAALHWMLDADAVINGIYRALKNNGRFVAEFGGSGNIAAITNALSNVLAKRGIQFKDVNPWYFPSVEEYQNRLTQHGFIINTIELIPSPTPLPNDISNWLNTFCNWCHAFIAESDWQLFIAELREILIKDLYQESSKNWVADYVRLRFSAVK